VPFEPGLPQKTLEDRVRFYPMFDCMKHSLSPDAEGFTDERLNSMSNVELLQAMSFALEEMEEEKAKMSDPRVDLLAKHIASVLVTLIDIARDGERNEQVAFYAQALKSVGEAPSKQDPAAFGTPVEAEPAARRGRPPKAEPVPAAADSSAEDPATPVSESGTATDAGSDATGRSTGPTPSTSAPSDETQVDTLAIAQELTIKLVQAKGRDVAVAALGDFNVGKASALAADQIGAYCEAVRELLAG
jgi:hypothetical protein